MRFAVFVFASLAACAAAAAVTVAVPKCAKLGCPLTTDDGIELSASNPEVIAPRLGSDGVERDVLQCTYQQSHACEYYAFTNKLYPNQPGYCLPGSCEEQDLPNDPEHCSARGCPLLTNDGNVLQVDFFETLQDIGGTMHDVLLCNYDGNQSCDYKVGDNALFITQKYCPRRSCKALTATTETKTSTATGTPTATETSTATETPKATAIPTATETAAATNPTTTTILIVTE